MRKTERSGKIRQKQKITFFDQMEYKKIEKKMNSFVLNEYS